ncbi:MAG: hypothetical protein P4L98_23145 [Ancalomicrobiaceae bacterium]|nr:hypothetical protein [Ancalomicrobiaceae bacterium]
MSETLNHASDASPVPDARNDRAERENVYSRRHVGALGMSGLAALFLLPNARPAAAKAAIGLESAGALEFGPDDTLFVGDSKAGAIHAFTLSAADFKPQTSVALGKAATFEGRDLVRGVDRSLAALLGATPDQVTINDLAVHKPSRQIFLSVHRGHGPDAEPVIVTVNDGKFDVLDLSTKPHSKALIGDTPSSQTLEFGQAARSLAITDIKYYQGELFVAGVSNEEFASKLRRMPFPFNGQVSTSSTEIWHSVHGQFETRAPIIKMLVREIDKVPHLIAVYACTPLVRFPLASLRDGAHVHGDTIGELGYGSTPVDMVSYRDGGDGKDYVLVTHNSRGATRVATADIDQVAPMPVNVPNTFGPAGIAQYPIALTGALHMDLIDNQWAVVLRHQPGEAQRLDLHTLPLPYFFDRADQVVEMNWPGGPDPFHYHTAAK